MPSRKNDVPPAEAKVMGAVFLVYLVILIGGLVFFGVVGLAHH